MKLDEFHTKIEVLLDRMLVEWRLKHESELDIELSEFRWFAEMVSYLGNHFMSMSE